ncbi:TasA family protein [Brevibacillus sp. SYSU BS000544]|uniref:TasA family protein n=1 Tax=Brevibacillus sp. SYSU BS000544 TaxID=3416443 RepID=UPI003CE57C9D
MKSLKKQFALAFVSIGLGAALIGGGTYAYFNDTAEVNNKFAAGKLDLSVNPTVAFDVQNLKPGDFMVRYFDIMNSGTLDIKDVLMHTSYTIDDAKGDNGSNDFASHLNVEFLTSDGQVIVLNKTLKELKALTDNKKSPDISSLYKTKDKDLPVGDIDTVAMKIVFNDNGQDQNIFQGDKVNLKFKLEATQTAGVEK